MVGVFGLIFLNKGKNSVYAHENKNFIKYAEFGPSYEALEKAMKEDIKSHSNEIKINWIDVLAYLGAKYGGNFKKYKEKDLTDITEKIKSGANINDLTKNLKNYGYYH